MHADRAAVRAPRRRTVARETDRRSVQRPNDPDAAAYAAADADAETNRAADAAAARAAAAAPPAAAAAGAHPRAAQRRTARGTRRARNTHLAGDPNAIPGAARNARARAGDVAATGAAPAPTPAATPRPTPTPLSCARPNVARDDAARGLEPDTPALAQQQGISGVVQVVVSLDAQSRVVGTRIQSSPSAVLNAAALAAARGSQFRTEVKNCEPVAADYIFSVDFTAQ